MKTTIKAGLASAALVAAIAPPVLVAAPAHGDPCFFGTDKFSAWYTGQRWGESLANVEAGAACVGSWEYGGAIQGQWNGNPEKMRLWARHDGGQTEIMFAQDNAGIWRAHDRAMTYDINVGGHQYRKECETPRQNTVSCTPSP